jgi:class 3 adenylate cyclase/tetratricopeptide (TPR) repeat protein/transcriptional regulator with XRE-family HTH domain
VHGDRRQLAAVMLTDMVGYSSLTQRDEKLALDLAHEQDQIVRAIVANFGGRAVKSLGDGVLVEFASALDAVRCALRIQEVVDERNCAAEGEHIWLRIGIHLGDVVYRDEDVFGDAVNIVARIEPHADHGGVCVSRQVYDQVHNKLKVSFESIGIPKLKNIETAIELYRIARTSDHSPAGSRASPPPAEQPALSFAGLLRQLRGEARLTQEELAGAASLSPRSISDLERGINRTARKDTAVLLADALNLTGPVRELFVEAARGRAPVAELLAARNGPVPGASAAAATRTLPRDIAGFTGRQAELAQLTGAVTAAAEGGGVMRIHAIGGMAGIGKTTFAVHAAHQLAPRFPDGQFFLPLHAHTPGQRPVDPADALASLLLTAGVAAQQIPPGLQARAARWRDYLAGKMVLLLLDDAAGHEQVTPLLPGTAGSLVLVTSRRHLTALADAVAISLDSLAPGEAAGLLARLSGRTELGTGPAGEITRLCGYLPLAIGMLAGQLRHHPAWTPAGLAAEMAAARDRLELMAAENLSVAAAFDLSYADLIPGQQRLFRRLGLHPGTDIDGYAAAALDATDLAAARRHLDALYDQYLLAEPARGRYRMHDLIRQHARGKAAADPPAETDAAVSRLLDYYQHTAAAAEALLARQTRTTPDPAALASPPTAVPDLPDRSHALSWARTERANLLACLDHAARAGQHARVVALTAAIAALLRQDGPWPDAITRHTTAVQAARHAGDRPGEADALNELGHMRYRAAEYPGAAQALERALGIYRDLGDRQGQANALNNLGSVRNLTADYSGATQLLEEALGIYRDLGDRQGQANALIYLGIVRQMTGDYRGAAAAQHAALGIYRDLGDRQGQANALKNLGGVQKLTEGYPSATQLLEEALGIYRDLGDRQGQASALNELGIMRRLTGDYPSAAQGMEEALGICRDFGDRGGEAETLNELGTLHRVRGDLEQAGAYHRQALDLAREIDSSWDEAHALAGLGRCALAAGRTADAKASLRQAQEIFQRIGAAEATGVADELDALTEAEPTAQKNPDFLP